MLLTLPFSETIGDRICRPNEGEVSTLGHNQSDDTVSVNTIIIITVAVVVAWFIIITIVIL